MTEKSKNVKNVLELPVWEKLDSEELFSSQWLALRRETCRLPSGRIIDDFFTLELPDGVAIIAVTNDNQLVLVRQYKHGLGKIVLELPAGNVDPDEDSDTAIRRELVEETGFFADQIEYITTLASKPTRMRALTHIYFASNVTLAVFPEDNDMEFIKTVLVPISELSSLIKKREIITETSLAAILSVWDRLQ